MNLTSLLNALPGAVAQGLIWGIMAIGVYITYKVLDLADLTVDGSMATGGFSLLTANKTLCYNARKFHMSKRCGSKVLWHPGIQESGYMMGIPYDGLEEEPFQAQTESKSK